MIDRGLGSLDSELDKRCRPHLKPTNDSWRLDETYTKNGMAYGEAVIFFDKALAADFGYRCKQAGQLASKMRFIAAPWMGLLETGAWLSNANHANQCAAYLEQRLLEIEGIELMFPRQTNALFVKLPERVTTYLQQQGWKFYTFIGVGGEWFVCSWNTTTERIDELVRDIQTVG